MLVATIWPAAVAGRENGRELDESLHLDVIADGGLPLMRVRPFTRTSWPPIFQWPSGGGAGIDSTLPVKSTSRGDGGGGTVTLMMITASR